jgi:putative ABC transport system permease protein
MGSISQIFAIVGLNLRSLRQRLGSSAVAIIGIAGVVAILITVLSIAQGFQAAMTSSASDLRSVMVLRAGTDTEMNSGLSVDDARLIGDAPQIERRDGVPLVSRELFVIADLNKKGGGAPANVPLRGVDPTAFAIRDRIEITEGRRFEPGTSELIVGAGAARGFEGLEVGSIIRWGQLEWRVVGHFSAGGSVAESEIWCDAKVLMPAYRREGYQSVYARLASPDDFAAFKDTLTADPRLKVKVMREADYYAEQSQALTTLIHVLGLVVGAIMALAAIFAAFNTMYTAVSARSREIATLRALGFKGLPVVVSVLAEAMLLGVLGGLLGGAAAFLMFNGFRVSTLNFQSFSQVAFAFRVTPNLLIQGTLYALAIGFFGGLLPAWRAARQPISAALRGV